MDRKQASLLYLSGALGQILVVSTAVFLLRRLGTVISVTTALGGLAIAIGGISSALWGVIVTMRYRHTVLKDILTDFIDIRQPLSSYGLVFAFLFLDFCYILKGGQFQVSSWYIILLLFFKAILFGGIEEIGWRYTFQPLMEEKFHYVLSTVITFVSWGIWHFLYFYVEGSLYQVAVTEFLLGLFTNCFLLSALYHRTKSLWICVMTHALINTLSQISSGGDLYISMICRGIILMVAIAVSQKAAE